MASTRPSSKLAIEPYSPSYFGACALGGALGPSAPPPFVPRALLPDGRGADAVVG
jgi:hypothetical protein